MPDIKITVSNDSLLAFEGMSKTINEEIE